MADSDSSSVTDTSAMAVKTRKNAITTCTQSAVSFSLSSSHTLTTPVTIATAALFGSRAFAPTWTFDDPHPNHLVSLAAISVRPTQRQINPQFALSQRLQSS